MASKNFSELIQFTEGTIKVLHRKVIKNVDLKFKMKALSQVLRRVMFYCTQTNEEFIPVALLLEKKDKTFILSKEKVKKEIEINGLCEFLALYTGLVPPKIIHISEIAKIEKMLEKDEPEIS